MFSYRHGFHAGNHADVLKHMVLIAVLKHLTAKPTALTVVDTHAGAGLYRLDDAFADTSGEARDGILKLVAQPVADDAPPLLADYLADGLEKLGYSAEEAVNKVVDNEVI